MVLEKTLESPLDCNESNQAILKEMSPEYSFKGLMLKLKLQYFGHLMRGADSLEKTLMWGWGGGVGGMTEDETIREHHGLKRHELEQTLGDGGGQGSLVCCSLWGHRELDTT